MGPAWARTPKPRCAAMPSTISPVSSESSFDLEPLREVVARAQHEQMAPPTGDEVKAYEPVEAYFSEEDWLALQAAVAAVRRLAVDTYNLYLSDQRVAATVVDALLGRVEEDFQHPELSFEQLVERLRERAGGEGPWLVATPLANFLAPAAAASDEEGKRAPPDESFEMREEEHFRCTLPHAAARRAGPLRGFAPDGR